jgi:tetratricopeptide (TPR) repeat protein
MMMLMNTLSTCTQSFLQALLTLNDSSTNLQLLNKVKLTPIFQSPDRELIIEELRSYLSNSTDDNSLYYKFGIWYAQSRHEYANEPLLLIRVYSDMLITIDKPGNFSALIYNNRGLCYRNIKKYELAILDYDCAIDLFPQFSIAIHNRGICYQHLGDHVRAVQDFSDASKLDPYCEEIYLSRARSYHELNYTELELRDYSRAILLNPGQYKYYIKRGNTYFNSQHYSHALKDYRQACHIDPECARAHFNLALTYIAQEQPTLAYHTVKKAVALKPDHKRYGQLMQQLSQSYKRSSNIKNQALSPG